MEEAPPHQQSIAHMTWRGRTNSGQKEGEKKIKRAEKCRKGGIPQGEKTHHRIPAINTVIVSFIFISKGWSDS